MTASLKVRPSCLDTLCLQSYSAHLRFAALVCFKILPSPYASDFSLAFDGPCSIGSYVSDCDPCLKVFRDPPVLLTARQAYRADGDVQYLLSSSVLEGQFASSV